MIGALQESVRLPDLRYQAGQSSYLNLLDAQRLAGRWYETRSRSVTIADLFVSGYKKSAGSMPTFFILQFSKEPPHAVSPCQNHS
ncbi:TPA: hypothetical protein DDW35_00565 [Candidatus Sumerlaeota bacterium]|nr:hypothetical protein [Candidatus Sumerlaeota bacterium]